MNEYHSFNVNLAKKLGVEKSLILGRIYLFVDHNKRTGKNLIEGKFWMYDTSKALQEVYPYLNQNSIRRWMIELEKDGWIESGNFNLKRYDKTKWYTLGEKFISYLESESLVQNEQGMVTDVQNEQGLTESLVQNEQSIVQNEHSIVQNEQPIPDIDHYRPNIKSNPSSGGLTFEEFWELYDKKVGKSITEKLFSKLSAADKEKIKVHVPRYVLAKPKTFRKDPERYLKHRTFNDEIVEETEAVKAVEILTYKEMLERLNTDRGIFKKYSAVDINGLRYVPNEYSSSYKPFNTNAKEVFEHKPQNDDRSTGVAEIIRNLNLSKPQQMKGMR